MIKLIVEQCSALYLSLFELLKEKSKENQVFIVLGGAVDWSMISGITSLVESLGNYFIGGGSL